MVEKSWGGWETKHFSTISTLLYRSKPSSSQLEFRNRRGRFCLKIIFLVSTSTMAVNKERKEFMPGCENERKCCDNSPNFVIIKFSVYQKSPARVAFLEKHKKLRLNLGGKKWFKTEFDIKLSGRFPPIFNCCPATPTWQHKRGVIVLSQYLRIFLNRWTLLLNLFILNLLLGAVNSISEKINSEKLPTSSSASFSFSQFSSCPSIRTLFRNIIFSWICAKSAKISSTINRRTFFRVIYLYETTLHLIHHNLTDPLK
mgnify:CR=1 FL=1